MADELSESKKRKRASDDTSRIKKKASVGPRPVHININKRDRWAPILASTHGLLLPEDISLNPYIKPRRTASILGQSEPHSSNELLLHSSDHAKIDYTGREEGGAADSLKHYVGIYERASGKMELMEARKMAVRGTVRDRDPSPDRETTKGMYELKNDLGQAFGTKKAKKAIASLTENAISRPRSGTLDAASQAVLATVEETTRGMSTREQLAEAANAAKPRPKANSDATDIKNVYTIENLVGNETQKAIPVADWLQATIRRDQVITKSRYVAHRLQSVGTAKTGISGAEETRIVKLKMLRYLLALVEFHGLLKPRKLAMGLPQRSALRGLAGMPELVVDSIVRKFSSGQTVSRFHFDLLITHICALACNIDNYEVDTLDISEDLHLDVKQLSKYFQEIGAKIVSCGEAKRKELQLDRAGAAQRKFATLKLPLEFPKLPFVRKR